MVIKEQTEAFSFLQVFQDITVITSDDINDKNPNIPWRMIAGTRDRLVHEYSGVNIDIVREIATVDIYELLRFIMPPQVNRKILPLSGN